MHYNIIQSTQLNCPAQGPHITYHQRTEQQSCSTIQNRSAHDPHLQQGSTNTDYKSTQQDLTEIKLIELRNAGSGIQGMVLAIIKVILRKSSLTKFFISTIETS